MRLLLILFMTFCFVNTKAQRHYYYSVQVSKNPKEKSYILYSKFGEKLINTKSDWIWTNYWGNVFCWKDKYAKVYDSTGRYQGIDSIQEICDIYLNSIFLPMKRGGYWGYYTKEYKLKIKHQYDDVTLFRNGKAAVKIKDNFYYIDTSGNILPEKYTPSNDYEFEKTSRAMGLSNFFNSPQATFKKENRVGLKESATGKILIEPIYDGIFSLSKHNVIVELNKKYGVINFSNKIIIPIKYEMIYLIE